MYEKLVFQEALSHIDFGGDRADRAPGQGGQIARTRRTDRPDRADRSPGQCRRLEGPQMFKRGLQGGVRGASGELRRVIFDDGDEVMSL